MKIKWNLIDSSFGHSAYSVAGVESNYCYWNKGKIDKECSTFYVNGCIYGIRKKDTSKEKSFGFLFESKAIIPEVYKHAHRVIDKFSLFFTHNSKLLKFSNARWIPGGGVWIGGKYGLGEIKIFEKSKLISMVSSDKKMCPLHRFRLQVLESVSSSPNIEIFGSAGSGWVPINKSLEEYMFSIVIENYVDDLYFTEKINNCFATGTIPIYFGATKINEIYNRDGIIVFSSITELLNIINNLSDRDYNKRAQAVKENFEKCKKFISIEDFIFENYFTTGETASTILKKESGILNILLDLGRKYLYSFSTLLNILIKRLFNGKQ